jgi:two-component system response regulator YesN
VDVITVATGDTCAATLNRIMSGERLSEFIPIGSLAIHTRGSTEDSSRDNKALDAALAYINDHIYETLTVRDIAKKVGIPVRTLFNITDERLGHTLKQEIIYRRLEATAARLLTTSDTVSDIALRYAFSDTAAFSNAFRKRFGKTPTEYRRSQR